MIFYAITLFFSLSKLSKNLPSLDFWSPKQWKVFYNCLASLLNTFQNKGFFSQKYKVIFLIFALVMTMWLFMMEPLKLFLCLEKSTVGPQHHPIYILQETNFWSVSNQIHLWGILVFNYSTAPEFWLHLRYP